MTKQEKIDRLEMEILEYKKELYRLNVIIRAFQDGMRHNPPVTGTEKRTI